MAASRFSPSSQYLVFSSPDGRLKLWDSNSGTLKQQFTPSAHLSTTCTCICWGSDSKISEKRKKKKSKDPENNKDKVGNQNLIALGTVLGNILIYNVSKADLETQLDDGHTKRVNGICWGADANSIYSCSSDAHIIHWSMKKGTIKCKWRTEGTTVNSLVLMDQDNLLSSSRSILWWDLRTKEVIKKFTGHMTEVNTLLPIKFDESKDHSYFLSSAENDKFVNIWKLDMEENDKSALGILSVNNEVETLDSFNEPTKSEPVVVAVVTKTGTLTIFKHQLNGRRRKPLKSTVSVMIASESSSSSHSIPIPILNAKIINSEEVLIVHGNYMQPTFERIKLEDCSRHTCLVRKHPGMSETSLNVANTKVRVPDVKKNAKVIAPGHTNPMYPQDGVNPVGGTKKRKHESTSLDEIAIEERLIDMRLRRNSEGGPSSENVPTRDNMMHLLIQGLQSNDQKMLNSVLQKYNSLEISNTVKKLPHHYILPLMTELTKRVHGKTQSNYPYVRWISSVLSNHASYFMMHQNVSSQLLRPLDELLSSRLELSQRFSRLNGKLELILSQVSSKQEDSVAEPLLVYEEDSPDEEDDFLRPTHSESEDNWDDLSDLEHIDKSEDENEDDSAMDTLEGFVENSEDEIDMT